MKKTLLLLAALLTTQVCAHAKAKAYAHVMKSSTQFIVKDANNATSKNSLSIMILSKKGADYADFIKYCDGSKNSITKFSGTVTDLAGNELRKIKKSDLMRTEISSELATDGYYMAFSFTPSTYPIIVTYEWEMNYGNGLLDFDRFAPMPGYFASVSNASYTLTVPSDISTQHHALNTTAQVAKTSDGKNNIYTVRIDSLPAIEREPHSPSFSQIEPSIIFEPQQFQYRGTSGSQANWQQFGQWQNGLLAGRDALTPAFKQQLHAMTDTCRNAMSKLQVLYNYLASHTRYVSIQLGLGGLQPFPAEEVRAKGFGDCKGLTNFMHAMLEEAGIESYYTVIHMNDPKFLPHDFAWAGFLNHVVLQAVIDGSTVWVECTNPELPLGYVHSGIAGHDALAITPQGGKLCQVPSYPDTAQLRHTSIDIVLDASGAATAQFAQQSFFDRYEGLRDLVSSKEKDKNDYALEVLGMPQATVKAFKVEEIKAAKPQLNLNVTLASQKYATGSRSRLFVPVNPLRKDFAAATPIPDRKNPFVIDGRLNEEEITIHLPSGYSLESMPTAASISEEVGEFSSSINKVDASTLVVKHRYLLKSGKYPAAAYKSFEDFTAKVAAVYQQKIVIKRD